MKELSSTRNTVELSSGCFKNLNQEDLDFIVQFKTQIEYQKGDTIFKQGAFASHVLFVNHGLVKIYLQTARRKQLNIRMAKQGDFMALSSIFGNEKYQYSAIAQRDSTVCMIKKEGLRELLLKNNDFAIEITSKNSFLEQRYLDIIKNVTSKQMRGKLASALLYLSSEELAAENVFNDLTRQDIADFASITLESAVKFLKEFEKEGLIKLNSRNISIENNNALEDISLRG